MIFFLSLTIIIILIIVIICYIWRFYSRDHSIPCPVWMTWLLDPPGGLFSSRTIRTMRRLTLRSGMNVLDAGCGPGRLSIPIAKIIGHQGILIVMDIQEGMLQIVRKRAERNNIINIRYIRGGIGDGKLEGNYYDRIVLITVLGEIPRKEEALQELFQALKPGGLMLVEETIRDPHFQTRGTVMKLAGAAGFIEKEVFGNRLSYTMILGKPDLQGCISP